MKLSNLNTKLVLLVLSLTLLVGTVQGSEIKDSDNQIRARRIKGKKSSKSRSRGSRSGKKGGTKGTGLRNNNRQGAHLDIRKNDNDYVFETELPIRRSFPSKMVNVEHETYLGGVRFTGEVCLKEELCDPIDFKLRDDSLLEAYEMNTDEDLGYCLTLILSDDDEKTNTNNNDPTIVTGLTMALCVRDNEDQQWTFIRTLRRKNPIFNFTAPLPDSLYLIYHPKTAMVLAAAHDKAWYDDLPFIPDYNDKNNKDEDKYKDDEEEELDITFQPLLGSDTLNDEKILWVVNEERLFNVQEGLFDLDDDIFGFLSAARASNGTEL